MVYPAYPGSPSPGMCWLEGLSRQIRALHATRLVNPWHWLLAADPAGTV
jgi:hypothetical protein